ncbi:MAG: arsenite methyltransferase [Ignavibacteria bacterium]|nr:arsenite methyltransferase [Ignavibacteria bacterium]
MSDQKDVKEIVKEKYAEIAVSSTSKCCCGSSNNKIVGYTIMKDDYNHLEGYVAEADLGLGCGLPTEFAGIKNGDTVVDLGSGAGNDVFVVRAIVGEEGKVIGVDMTEAMIEKANRNNAKLGYNNVEFKFGDIEAMPLENNIADVIVSNCVLNLVPDKKKAFDEIYRVLKPGAHFCVSDIVIKGELHPELKKSAAMYAGCVAGAVQQDEYFSLIEQAGFVNVEIKKTKTIELPDEVLLQYLNTEQLKEFNVNQVGIFSITVVGYKS